MQIELRRLLGKPLVRSVLPSEEGALRNAMDELDGYRLPVESRKAVLIARDDGGELIGAWNRKGSSALLSVVPFRREFRFLFGSPLRFGIQLLIMGVLFSAFSALSFDFDWRSLAVGVLFAGSMALIALVVLLFYRLKGRSRFAAREARPS